MGRSSKALCEFREFPKTNETFESSLIHRSRKPLCPATSRARSITWRAVGQPDVSCMRHSPPSIIQTHPGHSATTEHSQNLPKCGRPHPQSWLLWHYSEPFVRLHLRAGGGQGLGIVRPWVSGNGFSSLEGHICSLYVRGGQVAVSTPKKRLTGGTQSMRTKGSLRILDAPTMASCIFFLRFYLFI